MNRIDLNSHAGYKAADEKLQSLRGQLTQANREESDLIALLGSSTDLKANELNSEVNALLAGGAVSTVATVATVGSAIVTRDELTQVRHEKRILAAAIDRQSQILEQERMAASAQICNRIRPAYKTVIKRMADILAALREAATEEYAIRHELIDAGVSVTNQFLNPFTDVGQPAFGDVRMDSIALWEREARNSEAL